MSDDVVLQAKAAMDKCRTVLAESEDMLALRTALAIDDALSLIPELVAEIERLRAVGARYGGRR